MKTLFLAILTIVLLPAGVPAEDAPKKEKSASPPVKYEPLVIPKDEGAGAAPVSSPQKELSKDREKDTVSAGEIEMSSPGRLVLPSDANRDEKSGKKQPLWIYTLPEEQAVRRQELLEESRRIEQWEQMEKARQLPAWAIDPKFQKYFLPPEDVQNPTRAPPSAGQDFFDSNGKTPSDDPSAYVPFRSLQPASDTSLFSGGTSLTLGQPPEKKKEDADFLVKPSGGADDAVRKDAGYGSLYQSNQRQKRIEDYYDGLNKPVEADEASDRYHKPQKPQ